MSKGRKLEREPRQTSRQAGRGGRKGGRKSGREERRGEERRGESKQALASGVQLVSHLKRLSMSPVSLLSPIRTPPSP